jgi:hypothetical protein
MMFSKSLSFFLVFLSGVSAGSLRSSNDVALSEQMPLFRAWSEMYEKVYSSEEQMMERLQVWTSNHGE